MRDSGDREGREPESATFETARVVRRRGRPPFFLLGFLVAIAALVAVGVGGRSEPPRPTLPAVALDSPGIPDATTASSPAPTPSAPVSMPRVSPGAVPVLTSGPGPIELQASRLRASVFVHGDVFVPRVTWVFVGLQDDTGQVVGWASVSVPGAAGPGTAGGPTLRFDVEVAVPDQFAGPLSLHANAYDAGGAVVGSTLLAIPDPAS